MKRFTIKKEHLKLLKNVYTSWDDCEFGAPEIDPKKPYGNSNVLSDMREILKDEGKKCPHCEEHLGGGKYSDDRLFKLHKELETVLEIVLRTQKFQPGIYIANDYTGNWSLTNSKEISFDNLNFVITGTLENFSRKDAEEIIKEKGGKVQSKVTENTDYLVCGERPGTKLDDAEDIGTDVIGEGKFLDMMGG